MPFGGLLANAIRQVGLEERTHFVAERVFFRCEAKVHGLFLALVARSSRYSFFELVDLEQSRRAHTAADAHGDDRVLGAAPAALDQDMASHARAAHAERVADRDRAAVHVELVLRDAEPVAAIQHL